MCVICREEYNKDDVLVIKDCDKIKTIENLKIYMDIDCEFSKQAPLAKRSLVKTIIINMKNLESVHLKYTRILHIENCPKLKYIDDIVNIQQLQIYNCPNIEHLGNMDKLLILRIDNLYNYVDINKYWRLSRLTLKNCAQINSINHKMLDELFLENLPKLINIKYLEDFYNTKIILKSIPLLVCLLDYFFVDIENCPWIYSSDTIYEKDLKIIKRLQIKLKNKFFRKRNGIKRIT